MLNAKIAIPQFSSKMNICEATVPVYLNSEAVWQNGELHVYIKDLGESCSRFPLSLSLRNFYEKSMSVS